MPLVDDLALPLSEEELSRRRFLSLLGSGALAVAGLGTAAVTLRFLEPSVLYEEDLKFALGRPEEIAIDTVLVLARQQIYVARGVNGFLALSSVCTHLGCPTRYEPEAARFACPCHGSRYSLDGRVLGGPSTRPLRRLALSLERGLLVVDAGKRVPDGTLFQVT